MILHHATAFGSTERTQRSVARARAARQRVVRWLGAADAAAAGATAAGTAAGQAAPGRERPAGVVLTGPACVAWACGGIAPPVDRTAAVDLVVLAELRADADAEEAKWEGSCPF